MAKTRKKQQRLTLNHVMVVLEDLRGEFRLFWEKLSSTDNKVNSLEGKMESIEGKLDQHIQENHREHSELKASIALIHTDYVTKREFAPVVNRVARIERKIHEP